MNKFYFVIVKSTIFLLLIFQFLSFFALSNDQISNDTNNCIAKIVFKGNYKTKPQIMRQEMIIKEGDPVDIKKIERSRQAILDLELFKSVKTELTEHKDGKVITITVEEKYYILPLPRVGRSSDGDIFYGGVVEFNNLMGLNQTMKTSFVKKELNDSYLNEEQTFAFYYSYPRINGSAYQFALDFDHKQSEIERKKNDLKSIYIGALTRFKCTLGYWLNKKGPSKGWQISNGIILDWKKYEYKKGIPDLYYDTDLVSLTTIIKYDATTNLGYNQKGKYFKYQLIYALKDLGSDVNNSRHTMIFRYYYPIPQYSYTNLNFQFTMEYESNHLFDDYPFKLGGSSNLRGYSRESIQGDIYMLMNFEYLTPIGYNTLRGALFVDIGNAYATDKNIDLLSQNIGCGIGARWKIRSLVRTDLRLDFAYSFEEKNYRLYFGAKAMF